MADKINQKELASTMGTAMQLLFQNKTAAMQSQPATNLPKAPPIAAPDSSTVAAMIANTNPATGAANIQEQKTMNSVQNSPSVLNSVNAASLLIPSKTVVNNTSASDLLKIKA